jgi:energy-converting hydrogenase Eha subunit H
MRHGVIAVIAVVALVGGAATVWADGGKQAAPAREAQGLAEEALMLAEKV